MTELPQVMDEQSSEHRATLQLHIQRELTIFKGHFDDYPIVPGIAEVDWALKLARQRLPVAGTFCGLSKIKFMRVIQPLADLTLTLEWQPQKLAFEYRDVRGAYSSGELLFAAP